MPNPELFKTVCPYCESEWVTGDQHDQFLAEHLREKNMAHTKFKSTVATDNLPQQLIAPSTISDHFDTTDTLIWYVNQILSDAKSRLLYLKNNSSGIPYYEIPLPNEIENRIFETFKEIALAEGWLDVVLWRVHNKAETKLLLYRN